MNNKYVVGTIPTKVVYISANEVCEKNGCDYDPNKSVKGSIMHVAEVDNKIEIFKAKKMVKLISSYHGISDANLVLEEEEIDNKELTDVRIINIAYSR